MKINGIDLIGNVSIGDGSELKRIGDDNCWISNSINNVGTLTTQSFTLNNLYAYHWCLRTKTKLTAVQITSQNNPASNSFRIGLYTDNGNFYPDQFVPNSDSGVLNGAAGNKQTTFAAPLILPAGHYWVVFQCAATVTMRVKTASTKSPLGLSNSGGVFSINRCWKASFTYGSFPGKFPSGAGFGSELPLVYMYKTQAWK